MNVPYIYSKSLIHIENIFILATIKFSKRRFSSGYRKVVKTNKETKKPHYLKKRIWGKYGEFNFPYDFVIRNRAMFYK